MLIEAIRRRQTAILVNVTSGDRNLARFLLEDGTIITLPLSSIYDGPLPLPLPHDNPTSARPIWKSLLGRSWLGSLWEWDGTTLVPSEATLGQFMDRLPPGFTWVIPDDF